MTKQNIFHFNNWTFFDEVCLRAGGRGSVDWTVRECSRFNAILARDGDPDGDVPEDDDEPITPLLCKQDFLPCSSEIHYTNVSLKKWKLKKIMYFELSRRFINMNRKEAAKELKDTIKKVKKKKTLVKISLTKKQSKKLYTN